jgi:MFS family permease
MRSVLGAVMKNRAVLRVVVAYAVFTVVEYSVWIAMLVYAYTRGGATEAGVIAVFQLVPAGLVAPFASVVADRSSPVILFVTGCVLQGVGMAIAAVAILANGPALLAFAGAVVASTFVSTVRPAQAALLPTLARTADELTASNVLVAGVEAVGITVAGLLSGALLIRGPGDVFAASVVLIAIAATVVAPLPMVAPAAPAAEEDAPGAWAEITDGARAMSEARGARTLVGLLAIQDVVLGALDVLFVVVAIALLQHGRSWAGYLNTAFGIGGIAAGGLTVFLIGRRLPGPILAASAVVGASLALTATTNNTAAVVLLLVVLGAARAVVELATRTLLQRSIPANVVGRIFGLLEGASMISIAIGSLLVSFLVALVGARGTLIAIGALLPVYALICAHGLLTLDRESRVPIVEINLLRAIPMFAQLPPPALEATARALEIRRLAVGDTLIAEGEPGDHYYAVADGDLEVSRGGQVVRHRGRGSGVGEIALLRSVPRTATVVATADSLVYALDRDSFLIAVTGHAPTGTAAARAVEQVLLEDRVNA